MAKTCNRQFRSCVEWFIGTHRVDAAQETAQPDTGVLLVQFRRVSATSLEKRKTEPVMLVQGLPVYFHRGDQGYFRVCNLDYAKLSKAMDPATGYWPEDRCA